MSRSRLFVAVAAGALLLVVARRAAVHHRSARDTIDAEPVLELPHTDHVAREDDPAGVDPDGARRIGLAPGRYTASWRLSGLGGSRTNHGSHLWNVAPDATTHVARFAPYVGWADATRG
jgi:hypothetical protein